MFTNLIGFILFLFWLQCFIMITTTKNLFVFLIQIEILIFLQVLLLNSFSWLFDDFFGTFFSVLLLPIAGCESAIGLILLLIYYPSRGTILIH